MTKSWDLPSGKWQISESGSKLLAGSTEIFEDAMSHDFVVKRLACKVDSNKKLYPPEFSFSPVTGESLRSAIESQEDQWAANLSRYPGGKSGDLKSSASLVPDWDVDPARNEFKVSVADRGHFELFSMKVGKGLAAKLPETLFAIYQKNKTLFMFLHDANFASGKWVELVLDDSSPMLVDTTLPSSAWRILIVEVNGVQTALIPTQEGLAAVRVDPVRKTFTVNYLSDHAVMGGPVLWQNQAKRKIVIVSAGKEQVSQAEVMVFDFPTDINFQNLICTDNLQIKSLASEQHWSWPFVSGRDLYFTSLGGVIQLGLSRDRKIELREQPFLPRHKACLWGQGVMHTPGGDDHLLLEIEDDERGKIFARYDYGEGRVVRESPISPFVACGEYAFRYTHSLADVTDGVNGQLSHFIPFVSNSNQKWCAGIQIEWERIESLGTLLARDSSDFSVCAAIFTNAKRQTSEITKQFKSKTPWNSRLFFFGEYILVYNTAESLVAPSIKAVRLLQKVDSAS